MSIRTRILEAQQARHEALNEPRPYTRTIELQREIGGCQCLFEVSVRQWTTEGPLAEIDCISWPDCFDAGGHEIRDMGILAMLNEIITQWCHEHIDDIIELIEKASKE